MDNKIVDGIEYRYVELDGVGYIEAKIDGEWKWKSKGMIKVVKGIFKDM